MHNRLARESSPYLRQHAGNPVDWYAWGPEALERAHGEDRPILLSIGYSACHWCHVMERESFEDPDTAALMNEAFVNVKVDREERPDVDSIYMRAVQALTGQGGWPLTVFLTPDGTPYYGGTYFPPEPRHGMPSFRQVLVAARDAWSQRREDVTSAATQLRAALERSTRGPLAGSDGAADSTETPAPMLEPRLLDGALDALAQGFDPVNGGLGSAPKFPQPMTLEFALRRHFRTGDPRALTMVAHTLRRMARGGIHDQLGGGFHRYAVDARWRVPHFEKMLYDNALLARLYLHAWQVTGDAELLDVAQRTLDYLLTDLRAPEGGFYSARDADSEGEEGRFYLWTADEVDAALDPESARLFRRCYDVSRSGNFEGRNILHLPHDLEAVARSEDLAPEELKARLDEARKVLLEVRSRRVAPFRDEKVLAAWNGLALRALAEAAGALGREDWLAAAVRCGEFLAETLGGGDRLLRVWMEGKASVPGFLEDYGAVGNGLLTLYEATLDPRWLIEVRRTVERMLDLFQEEEGLFFDAPRDGESLVVRPRDPMDNATPSGNSLAVELLLRAGALFGEEGWQRAARRALQREAPSLERFPSAFGRLLCALDLHLHAPLEVAILGPRDDPRTRRLLGTALRPYLPGRLVAGGDGGADAPAGLPILEGRMPLDGRATAYVCRDRACSAPVTEPGELAELLRPGA